MLLFHRIKLFYFSTCEAICAYTYSYIFTHVHVSIKAILHEGSLWNSNLRAHDRPAKMPANFRKKYATNHHCWSTGCDRFGGFSQAEFHTYRDPSLSCCLVIVDCRLAQAQKSFRNTFPPFEAAAPRSPLTIMGRSV